MISQRDLPRRMRIAGFFASIIAVAALAGTADNHHAGFGHAVTNGEQVFLFVIAALPLAAPAIRTSDPDPSCKTSSEAPKRADNSPRTKRQN